MRKIIIIVLLVMAVGCGFVLYPQREQIHSLGDAITVLKTSLELDPTEAPSGIIRSSQRSAGGRFRVASFDLGVLDGSKLQDERAMSVIGKIIREFDIVALQGIKSNQPGTMVSLMDWINLDHERYGFVISHQVGRAQSKEQYAYVYDRDRIELDRSQSYVINDPDDLLSKEPFVVWCRVKGPEPEQAFTFSLVNVHTEPEELQYELSWLDDVFRRVRDDGRGEDDVIMLGNFNASDRSLGELKHVPGMHAVIHEMATNTQGTGQFDNILFSLPATSEYSGRGGVYDFYNRFDMTMDEALRISNHLPVWAEFNPIEGGADGVVLSASRELL